MKKEIASRIKNVVLVIVILVIVLSIPVALVVLQPSPQEAALGNLAAADKLLEQMKVSEPADKLESASKELRKLRLPGAAQRQLDLALTAIADAKVSLEGDRARLSGVSSEIKTQIAQAQKNLTAPTAFERAKGVKDQILGLLWPVLIAVLILYMLHSKTSADLFRQLATMVSNIKVPGGLEIAFASTAVRSTQEDLLKTYRQQVISTYDAAASQQLIADGLSRIVKGPIKEFFGRLEKRPDFRCTIHVRDILFDNSLYQLTDYVGRESSGRGRAWSVRRGMIGRIWRLEKSEAQGSIPKDPNELIDKWGLTRDEAESPGASQTMLCHVIKSSTETPVAILYLDAKEPNAFGNAEQMQELLTTIETKVKEYKLDQKLEQVWQDVHAKAPLIQIYADRK